MMFFLAILLLTLSVLSIFTFPEMLIMFIGLELIFYTLSLLKNWFHVMMILMVMEMFMLKNFLLINLAAINTLSPSLIFIFTTFMVMEASMGMSILTLLTRSHGNDFLLTF
uniref:NADH dehydrogenase subunit 4L n=1 Tax=Lovenula raynerae TaxID=2487506 RepID=A0A3G4YLJ7_9MAXI|nr:NADH dehydrogenase subunit 4L [Lovenula raynerae]